MEYWEVDYLIRQITFKNCSFRIILILIASIAFYSLALNLGGCGGGGDGGGRGPTPAPQYYWAKTYGGGNDDIAHSIQQTSDGGFIVAGETYSFGVLNADIWVFKINSKGGIQWEKTFGGGSYDFARCIQQTSDGGFIVGGETSSFGANTEVWVLKLDADGNIQWQKTYGGGGDDVAHSIQQTSDGGYIVAGETDSFGAGFADFWVLKLDSNGEVLWQKTYGGGEDDIAHSIQQTSDGGFIVAGETASFGAGFADFWVLKLDSNGDIVWQMQKTYGGSLDDKAYSVQQTSDSGYIVAGKTSSFGNPILGDMWVMKLDSNGVVIWEKTYGGPGSNAANFIRQTLEGEYIVAGETSSFGAGKADVWLLKLDINGNIGSQCGVIGTSTAIVSTTGVTPAISSGSLNVTNATPAIPPSVSTQDSGATVKIQCPSP